MANIDCTEALVANPERFMTSNVVMQWIQHERPEIVRVGAKYIEGAGVANLHGARVCFFYLKPEPPCLSVYWCPYSQDSFKSTMLGNDALFAMTPAVTGCSVGLGSGDGGVQMMCHVNSARIGVDWRGTGQEAARQASSQDAQIRYKLGQGATIASPVAYRATDQTTMVTFLALHGLGQPWQLWGLSYRKLGPTNYFHAGFTQY
ncbi:hypothetical protein BTA51_03700 [Hahella sp. CCB-MM4]|uniref:hypothetical protein n=1 Tax=Hahella sp. (strain CCB-MM4) TaxID=1926491 RepID=UPI000B9B3754|nr:hypothetical protein [Hahella sp. CCB-MM4]OZG74138.1 hypothetical protein BTA51_03700 [Hahella sp. CCB-MM4]